MFGTSRPKCGESLGIIVNITLDNQCEYICNNCNNCWSEPRDKTFRKLTHNNRSEQMAHVEKTLNERGKRYGKFEDYSFYFDGIISLVEKADLPPVQKSSMSMIASKIARILSGDPVYVDNWHDIQGYAKLVEDHINKSVGSVKND